MTEPCFGFVTPGFLTGRRQRCTRRGGTTSRPDSRYWRNARIPDAEDHVASAWGPRNPPKLATTASDPPSPIPVSHLRCWAIPQVRDSASSPS